MQCRFCKIFLSVIIATTLFISNINATTIKNSLTTIDTLVLYSQDVANKYEGEQETRIEHLITTTNSIFKDSGLNIQINVVKIQQYYMDSNFTARATIKKIQNDTNITKLRNSVGADEVLIYRPYTKDGVCGLGYINHQTNPDYAYAYVGINCASYHTAHEIGHNLGLYHSEKSSPNIGYARGYGIEHEFETIMAYKKEYNGKKVYKFSSPLLDCDGEPCGIDEGYEHEADAVKAIKNSVLKVASFREHIDNNTSKLNKAQKEYEFQKKRYEKASMELNRLYKAYSRINSTYKSLSSQIKPNSPNSYKLYILKIYRDKFYQDYDSYKNNTYLPIEQEFMASRDRYLSLNKKDSLD